jgi:DNA-binding NarL/FixJ family response regulator
MRQVREVLRLTTAGVGLNEIARRVGVAASTVRLNLKTPGECRVELAIAG